ncbi:MAG: ribbon-helix-helix protein, CopG family [Armatimonadota bacterium]|nr:ribbon-helix-helix protein, CopG family [Armatimonadota bacterium]
MATKRLTIELPVDQHEFLRKEAAARGTTVSALIRKLIEEHRARPSEDLRALYSTDPFARRSGSFDGPPDLAERHDRYLYRSRQGG